MKAIAILILIITSFDVTSQISFGYVHTGPARKLESELIQKIKSRKTYFALSSLFIKDEYDFILKESWKATEYKVLTFEEYLNEDFKKERKEKRESYNVLLMSGYMKTTDNGTYLYIYLNMLTFNYIEEINRKKNSTSEYEINQVARIELFPKEELRVLNLGVKEDNAKFSQLFYNEASMYNYSLGFLKNYFQKLSNLIEKETPSYWLYENGGSLPELGKLTDHTLYVPDYILKHTKLTENESLSKTFKNYPYKIEFIETEKLDEKIINEEEIYYFRYVQVGAQKFWQVINSKSGEILYRGYAGGISGLGTEIKAKHISELVSAIKKAKK
jgi:hypothetical protein